MEDEATKKDASISAHLEINCPSSGKEGGPSLNSLALARKAFPQAYFSSDEIEEWRRAVYKGVLLKNQKFWVHEKLHKNCFLVLPKACDIAWSDDESCWSWITKEEKCFPMAVDISVPKSKELSWLLIRGRFKTRALSPNTTYEVAFVVKLDRNATGCMHAVTLKLELPDETKQTDTKSLTWQPVDQRMNLRAGEFVMGPKTVGTIYFALHGVESHREETSLILEGVLIHPKDEAKQ